MTSMLHDMVQETTVRFGASAQLSAAVRVPLPARARICGARPDLWGATGGPKCFNDETIREIGTKQSGDSFVLW